MMAERNEGNSATNAAYWRPSGHVEAVLTRRRWAILSHLKARASKSALEPTIF